MDIETPAPTFSVKETLKELVAKFREWIFDNYTVEEIAENSFDDTGYPYWAEIENYFSEILQNEQIQDLDEEDKKNILWLIARNWDHGSMISWLAQKRPLSWLGNLSDQDFIELARTVVELNHIEFEDAKCQFISSFKKFENLTPELEKILLRAYETDSEYIKRLALLSLAKLDYSDIRNLIKNSWETEDSEHHRMGCIGAILEYLGDEELLKEYLDKASFDNRKYISAYIEKIKTDKNLV